MKRCKDVLHIATAMGASMQIANVPVISHNRKQISQDLLSGLLTQPVTAARLKTKFLSG